MNVTKTNGIMAGKLTLLLAAALLAAALGSGCMNRAPEQPRATVSQKANDYDFSGFALSRGGQKLLESSAAGAKT